MSDRHWDPLFDEPVVVFISCVSPEFRQIRGRVAAILTRVGYTPVFQEIFGTEPGDLRQVLRDKIDACKVLIQRVMPVSLLTARKAPRVIFVSAAGYCVATKTSCSSAQGVAENSPPASARHRSRPSVAFSAIIAPPLSGT